MSGCNKLLFLMKQTFKLSKNVSWDMVSKTQQHLQMLLGGTSNYAYDYLYSLLTHRMDFFRAAMTVSADKEVCPSSNHYNPQNCAVDHQHEALWSHTCALNYWSQQKLFSTDWKCWKTPFPKGMSDFCFYCKCTDVIELTRRGSATEKL